MVTQLPTFKGYTVDYRLKEFRKAIPEKCLEFIAFDSRKGKKAIGTTKKGEPMAYTPELSIESCRTLRRIAWSMNKPMTKTIEWILADLVRIIPSGAICESCKDPSYCGTCPFKR